MAGLVHPSSFRVAAILCASFLLGACSTNDPRPRVVTLASGQEVRVVGIVPIHFSQGDPALMLKYETDLTVSDLVAMRKEVDQIWALFREDVERGNYHGAIVSANEVPRGLIFKSSKSYNFVYERRVDGTWHCVNDDKPSASR